MKIPFNKYEKMYLKDSCFHLIYYYEILHLIVTSKSNEIVYHNYKMLSQNKEMLNC